MTEPEPATLEMAVDAFERLYSVWGPHLTASESNLVGWLIANTISRGTRSEIYSLPQLMNGLSRSDGTGTCGTGLSERTLRRVTQSIREKGLIHTKITARGTMFAVNLNWEPGRENVSPG